MMKICIRIFAATLLFLGACKTQKPVVQDNVTHAPVETVQPKADTATYNYQPPRYYNYSIPKKILKDLENYESAFEELKAMLQGTKEPNFERAVFISENPYHNNKYTYEEFQNIINIHLYCIASLMVANDKSDSMDFNVKVNQYGRFNVDDIRHLPDEKKVLYKKSVANWAIFTYITDTVYAHPFFHKPYTYTTHDPFGIKDWSNSQVINLLYSQEQKGNCFSMTALFKIFSDRLKSEARICTAPQHIYIQHRDKKGDYYNVELATAGHPGDGTIQTLTHTTTEAIKSGIALRSFDDRQSIGLCLVNLAKSYEHKFGSKDDDFLLKCAELVLKHDRLNLNALLLKQQVLDAKVTNYSLENNVSDINKLRADNEISQTLYELEKHLALLYRMGYRQMPFDMQKIIMTGIIPENFEDKNPSPFTTIVPKEEHKKHYKALYGGLFQEVFENREFEPYGHFTFQTTTGKITIIDTTTQTGFLIDPVAFAYDFGARMYDARLGRWSSVDPLMSKYPSVSPYAAFNNNPILYVDLDGREWVNAFDAIVAQTEKALLDNPTSTKLQKQLTRAKENQAKTNKIIENFKANDRALYNYIDNLTVKDAVTGEKINVKVTVAIDYLSNNDDQEYAKTTYKNKDSEGQRKYVEYKGLEGGNDVTFAPLDNNDEVGFNVTIYFLQEWSDEYLANEVGDVMFRMEYPQGAWDSGTDAGKPRSQYSKKGSAGYYSNQVQEKYHKRKKSGEGKDPDNNPYPLKNE